MGKWDIIKTLGFFSGNQHTNYFVTHKCHEINFLKKANIYMKYKAETNFLRSIVYCKSKDKNICVWFSVCFVNN